MPHPGLPPTPGSSSDIKGQDGSQHLNSLHLAFELPPPALHDASRISPTDFKTSTTSNYSNHMSDSPRAPFPMQAAEAVKSRRRSSATKEGNEGTFALPPPPTRSRKIIQMKPKSVVEDDADKTAAKPARSAGKGMPTTAKTSSSTSSKESGKKKQPSATSVAGRKIARKTAHSLIERRRRSKMNEEFALLKSMIPACTGEMHKLAILQASIEYLRYLEDCVAKLKAQHDDQAQQDAMSHTLPSISEFHPTFREEPADVEMSDSETASPTFTATADRTEPTPSPALLAQDSRRRQHSYSSVSTDRRHYSFSTSATTSPAFGPQPGAPYAPSNASAAGSALTSPALGPQSDLDHEATAALLMLNTDRRGTVVNGRGLSVRDLLSA
ncbi:hypothetical protein NLU13_1926 [Sarocladium strictum]|uniref:BHLH domain-containing protein n=1 Tax=Sarocladium strictum TaxID=5046 RepID=A0AA39LC81_SARSR|nr:hypothetical protein NLU13_1926 [Sarocladium strictum]